MKVYFLDVGQGDCTFIKCPNGTTILVDCNISNDDFLFWLEDKLPENDDGKKILDYLIITHPHEDHIKGIGKLKEYIIKNIWESGHRMYIPEEEQKDYPHYYDMLDLIQKVKKSGNNHKKLSAYNEIEITDEPDVKFLVLSPTKAYLEDEKPTERDIHDQCMVFRIEYKGISIMFTGDSSMEAWKERIVPYYSDDSGRPNLLDSTLLHASHHGSYTFFKPKGKKDEDSYITSIEKIDPKITIISVGENNVHGHPDEDALELYKKHTFNKQVFMTKEHGTLHVEINEDGNYSIFTDNMLKAMKKPTIASIRIDAIPLPENNGLYSKGILITFKAVFTKLPSDQKVANYKWIVQNNATGEDHHHDWYIGDDSTSKTYENATAYTGSHTLLCEVRNSRGNIIAANTLIVNVE